MHETLSNVAWPLALRAFALGLQLSQQPLATAFACQLADSDSGLQLRPHHSLALYPSVAAGIRVAGRVQREPLGRRFAAGVRDS